MTDQKTLLTKILLEKLGIEVTEKNLKNWYALWWVNPRPKGLHSMRLTERGIEDFEEKIDLKCYKILFPKPLENITNKFILDLEKYIDGPYYITRTYIKVFTEKIAIQLILFGGDLQRYQIAKIKSNKK